jgi:hypothetical protein
MAAKSVSQVILAAAALLAPALDRSMSAPVEEICIALALIITVTYTLLSFWRHRRVYLSAI